MRPRTSLEKASPSVKERREITSGRRHPAFAVERAQGMKATGTRANHARAEIVRMAGGGEVLLAVISEGQAGAHSGDAARLVLEHVFRSVSQHQARDLNEALQDGIKAGSRALEARHDRWGSDVFVSVTAAAARHGRIYHASAGAAPLYLVSDGECRLLAPRGSPPLSPAGQTSIQTGPKEGLQFNPEGQLVLASSSLVASSPEDQRPYVQAEDIPGYVSGNPPMEAARHIVSIALGRDVADDVSVIVLRALGRRKGTVPLLTMLVAITAVLLLIAVGALVVQRMTPSIPGQTGADYGYAVLVDGDVLMETSQAAQPGPVRVRRLETIPAGSRILAQVDSRLGIQTTYEGPSELSALTFYLSAGSIVRLTWLDPHEGASEGGGDRAAERTVITLDSGTLLLRRSGGSRWTQVLSADTLASFSPPGVGVLAVVTEPTRTVVQCLVGGCVLQVGEKAPVFIEAPGIVEVRNGVPGAAGALSSDEVLAWNGLCGGCLDAVP